MSCKGLCSRHAIKHDRRHPLYDGTIRYCAICVSFFKTKTSFCVCCGCRMRSTPRGAARAKFLKRIQAVRY
jgi:hypothetical protein